MTISNNIRKDFPFFNQKVNGKRLDYLDSAATSQKPQIVIDSLNQYYSFGNANIHRGVYQIAEQATEQFESVRDLIKDFIHADRREEIVFTKGATQSLNWVAFGFFKQFLKPGDEILISVMEHHSNLVPWQQIAKLTGAHLKYVQLNDDGEFDLEDFKNKLNHHVKVVAVAHVSNVLGSLNPVEEICRLAHDAGSLAVVDGAQAVGHLPVNVHSLDCDFYAFSAHKMFGPTGVGVLYGKYDLLNQLKPVEYGGEMIEDVDYQNTTFKDLPLRLEAGTQNIAGVIGLGAAVRYIDQVGLKEIETHNSQLLDSAFNKLSNLPEIKIYGSKGALKHHDIISFNLNGIHPHDAATVFDSLGVEVRAGHHCAQVLMRYFNISACLRISIHAIMMKKILIS